MITHAEAQALLSERLDAPLDPYVESVLEAHLASCDECRAFAHSSEYLASSLRFMPMLPASDTVRNHVWAAIEQQERSWWRRFLAAMTGQTAAVVSTAAVALIVIAFASVAIMRLVDTSDGDNDPGTRLAAGTQNSIALATGTSEPSATVVDRGHEPTATAPAGETTLSTETAVPETAGADVTDAVPTKKPASGTESTSIAAEPSTAPDATREPVNTDNLEPTAPPESARFGPASATEDGPTDLTGQSSTDSTSGEEPSAVNGLKIFDPSSLLATTEADLKTSSPAPTATSEPPTETSAPTATPEPPTETPAPTATSAPPTETPAPTATPEPPTETPAPTATQTPEEDASNSPMIEPVDGATVVDSAPPERAEPTATEPSGQADESRQGDEAPVIGPAGQSSETTDSSTEKRNDDLSSTAGSDSDNRRIEPASDTSTGDASTATDGTETPLIESTTDGGQAPATESDGTSGGIEVTDDTGGYALADADYYSDGELWGSPDARLGYDDGVVFRNNPDGFSLQRDDLDVRPVSGENGQSLVICGDRDCADATSNSATGTHTDEVIGWVGDRLIYQRTGDGPQVEIRAVLWNGSPTSDEQLGAIDAAVSPLGNAYRVDSGTLIPTSTSWLLVADGDARIVGSNPYGDVSLVRTNFNEDLITYVAGGNVIVASISSPADAMSTIPFNGVDYDLSTSAGAVAISTGHGIEIYDLGGTRIGASDTSIATGSLLWLKDGIVFIDQTNDKIRLVDPALLTDQ